MVLVFLLVLLIGLLILNRLLGDTCVACATGIATSDISGVPVLM